MCFFIPPSWWFFLFLISGLDHGVWRKLAKGCSIIRFLGKPTGTMTTCSPKFLIKITGSFCRTLSYILSSRSTLAELFSTRKGKNKRSGWGMIFTLLFFALKKKLISINYTLILLKLCRRRPTLSNACVNAFTLPKMFKSLSYTDRDPVILSSKIKVSTWL